MIHKKPSDHSKNSRKNNMICKLYKKYLIRNKLTNIIISIETK